MKGEETNMKKISAILLVMLLLLAGCGEKTPVPTSTPRPTPTLTPTPTSTPTPTPDVSQGLDQPSDVEVEKTAIPGSWTVPDGWVKMDQYSSAKKIFYVEEGHEDDELPDNISISVGRNRYSAEEHVQFRQAIVQQLVMQISGADAALTGNGSYTEQGYNLYTFTITEEEEGIVTTQFYIVGDQRYCLVHLTNFTGSERPLEVAQAIVNSFVWSE